MPDNSERLSTIEHENSLSACQILGQRLLNRESEGRIFIAGDALGVQNLHELVALQQSLAERGVTLLLIDGAATPGARGHLYDAIQAFLATLETRRQLSEQSQELFEFLNVSLHELSDFTRAGSWSELYRDAFSRLWVSLAQQIPVSMLILNAERLTSADREHLVHLMRYFYSDPIHALLPESEAWERARGSIVLAGAGCEALVANGIEHEVLVLPNDSEKAVRQFLARKDVVQRFVRTIGGDPARLDELVQAMPEGIEQFWMHRFQRLELAGQRLLEILAVAQGSLAVDRLHYAAGKLGEAVHFTRHVNALTQAGFLRRQVGSGEVLLTLEPHDFVAPLVVEISQDRQRAIHRALAEAELHCNAQAPCAATLARHLLAGGEVAQSVQYGVQAARQWVQRCEFQAAADLLEPLLEVDCRTESRVEIHAQLAHIYTTLGNHRKALLHCDFLKDHLASDTERIEWLCHTANLLVQIGQGDSAMAVLEQASVLLDAQSGSAAVMLRVEIFLGKGEASYALGRSEDATHWAQQAILAQKNALQMKGQGENARADANVIKARNLLGKIAIFEAQYEQATEYFQQNDLLAAAWGWEREVARAQANLGVVQLQLRNYGEAMDRLTHALSLSSIPGSLPRAYCLLNLGIVHQRQAHFEQALTHYLEALREARRSGNNVAYSISAHNLATLYQDMGAFERAWKVLEHLKSPQDDGENQHAFVERWTGLLHGNLLLEQEEYLQALDAFTAVSQDDVSVSEIVYGAEAALRMVEANLALGNVRQARDLLAKYEAEKRGGDEPQLNALVVLCKSGLALKNGELEQALAFGKSAAAELTKLGMFRDALQAQLIVADVFLRSASPERAGVVLQQAVQAVRLRAERVPKEFRAGFYALGLHQRLIRKIQQVQGEIPAEFSASVPRQNLAERAGADSAQSKVSAREKAVVAPVRDAAFQKWRAGYGAIIGESARLIQIFRFVDRVAASDTSVLLTGESGTGKELIAEALHERSHRAKKAFVRVNCAAFVESLLLSELFGHEKGAFTGAQSAKAGRFELADGGTLFLDEIGDISPNTQVALLRVLQEGTFERVGGTETRHVNVRVICATNKNLDEMVKRGEFRLDLYYRLKGLVLEMPALRERREDIPRLLQHFAERYSTTPVPRRFSREAMRFLCAYSWSGNIRELENFVKSILLFVEGDCVEMTHIEEFHEFFADGEVDLSLPEVAYEWDVETFGELAQAGEPEQTAPGQATWMAALDPEADAEEALVEHIVAQGLSLTKLKKRLELECIKRALEETNGNITRAAELLQMKRPRLSQIINSTPELMVYRAELVG